MADDHLSKVVDWFNAISTLFGYVITWKGAGRELSLRTLRIGTITSRKVVADDHMSKVVDWISTNYYCLDM